MHLSSLFTELLEHGNYDFAFNSFSLIFGGLILFTLLVVGKFSRNYLKGERGETRFWSLFSFFAFGMLISCFGKTLKQSLSAGRWWD